MGRALSRDLKHFERIFAVVKRNCANTRRHTCCLIGIRKDDFHSGITDNEFNRFVG